VSVVSRGTLLPYAVWAGLSRWCRGMHAVGPTATATAMRNKALKQLVRIVDVRAGRSLYWPARSGHPTARRTVVAAIEAASACQAEFHQTTIGHVTQLGRSTTAARTLDVGYVHGLAVGGKPLNVRNNRTPTARLAAQPTHPLQPTWRLRCLGRAEDR
jgi:hypothetical protein